MSDKPRFDVIRATFYLIAFVVAIHLVIVVVTLGFCLYYGDEIVAGQYKCDADNRVKDLLTAALAAALALLGTRLIGR